MSNSSISKLHQWVFFPRRKTTQLSEYENWNISINERLWFKVQAIMVVKETTRAVAGKSEKETVLNGTRTIDSLIARSGPILNLSEVVSRAESTWNVKPMTIIYTAPERYNANSEMSSSQMSCWLGVKCTSLTSLMSFHATAQAPSSMWYSL